MKLTFSQKTIPLSGGLGGCFLGVTHTVKNSSKRNPKIILSDLNSIDDREEFKDSIDIELNNSPAALSHIRYDKLQNQLSMMSNLESNDSLLDVVNNKMKNRSIIHRKHFGKKSKRRKNFSVIPKKNYWEYINKEIIFDQSKLWRRI